MSLRAPFPWYGGKSRACLEVQRAVSDGPLPLKALINQIRHHYHGLVPGVTLRREGRQVYVELIG